MATDVRRRVTSRLAAGLLLASLVAPLAAAQPWQVCGNSSNYMANSTYQANLRQLSATLPTNASGALFATAAVGEATEVAYALALCRGDSKATSCASCIASAFVDALQLCPYNKDAALYLDDCNLRFSNENFLATTGNSSREFIVIVKNTQNVTSSVKEFDASVGVLLNATADSAAIISPRRFATGEADSRSSNLTIYGLAQCTPDMSPADCRSCLREMIMLRPQYLSGRQGGRINGVRCNFRYELKNKFFIGAPTVQLQTQLWPPKNVTAMPTTTSGGRKINRKRIIALATTLSAGAALLSVVLVWLCFLRKRNPTGKHVPSYGADTDEDTEFVNSLLLDIATLRAATDNFADSSVIGEGGFGAVYKGVLPDGQEIAVKRFFQISEQGIQELKNELVLVAKLQHKNLIRLVGVSLQEHEKLLVYEYMPNRSVDTILFDPEKRKELDWGRRFNIITGIARGLRYLHEDSQFKVIHRDLKASNVLLDSDYSPKISDFGLARLSGGGQDQSQVTKSVIGTYGYMAPEYAMHGHYSVKSDVFSFGVLVLEILTGRRSSGSYNLEESVDLLSLVWEHWTTEKIMEIMDPSIIGNTPGDILLKCVHIGLLCTQDNPTDRPTMSTVNVILSSNTVSLRAPLKPLFFIPNNGMYANVYSESYPATTETMLTQE